jgi:hypothetical protein
MKLIKEYAMVVLCRLLCLIYRDEIITKRQKEGLKGIPLLKNELLLSLLLAGGQVTISNMGRKLHIN